MEKYNSYKDSDVEWLREVPNHWKVEKIKRRMSFEYGSALKGENRIEGNFKVYGSNGIVGTHEYGITKGETIIIGRKGTAGALNYSYETCYPIDTAYFIDESVTNQNLRFLFYALHELDLDKMNEDSAVPGLSRESVYDKRIVFPSRAEQTVIATYLDQATEKINSVITTKQQQLEKLEQYKKSKILDYVTKGLDANVKSKPSGVEWIGNVPDGWKIKRIKDIASLQSGDNITSEDISQTGDYPVYGGNGLRGYFTEYTHEGFYALIGRQGALCGNINYAEGKFWASEHAVVVTIFGGSDMFWLGEVLREMNLNQYSQSAAQPGLAVEKIRNLKIPYPRREEQKEISRFIRNLYNKIDKEKSIIEQQIEKLKLYSKCLIHECVTGKRKVTDD